MLILRTVSFISKSIPAGNDIDPANLNELVWASAIRDRPNSAASLPW